MPYQVFGLRVGALAFTIAWIRSAMTRSGFAISAIFASTSLSPYTLPERASRRSLRVSLIAARSSGDNKKSPLPAVRRTDVCAAFFLLMCSSEGWALGVGTPYPPITQFRDIHSAGLGLVVGVAGGLLMVALGVSTDQPMNSLSIVTMRNDQAGRSHVPFPPPPRKVALASLQPTYELFGK